MAKNIIFKQGRTFGEFSLLTGFTPADCKITDIGLETKLAENLCLHIPLLSAAMTSVTGFEMALSLGKEGGLGILPARLSITEQSEIVRKIKEYEMSFVEDPITLRENVMIEEALRLIEQHGHSKIPIVDRNNTFLGMFIYQHYLDSDLVQENIVTDSAILPDDEKIRVCHNPEISVSEAKKILRKEGRKHLIVLDEQDRLIKLAFEKDVEKIKIGAAITTYEDWEKRVEKNAAAGVDLFVLDTSDAHSEFVVELLKIYKSKGVQIPICAGNIITAEGADLLIKHGADMLKIGMSSGSICSTQRVKATGRAPMTALIEIGMVRDDYFRRNGKYIPIIMDGGIKSSADMIIALSIADAVMMGGYFNRFYEAAGEKFDANGKETRNENKMVRVATWGEGSMRARNLDRYGHASKNTFFEEGVEGSVPYFGRLKPYLKKDLMKIRAALSNTGSKTLQDFRKNAILELNSIHSRDVTSKTHSIIEKER